MRYLLFALVLTCTAACTQKPSSRKEATTQVKSDPKPVSNKPIEKVEEDPVFKKYVDGNSFLIVQKNTSNVTEFDEIYYVINPFIGRKPAANLGGLRHAMAIYTERIKNFPQDARAYHHRGLRYISVKKFEEAIADLEKADSLIQTTVDQIEPDGMPNAQIISFSSLKSAFDGMPNAQNTPLSSLQRNIWYHLGLAYYLTHQYEKAYQVLLRFRDSGSNYDNIVSSTHWLYMIQQRLGNPEKADSLLAPIKREGIVLENQAYADLCGLYKGWISADSLAAKCVGLSSPSQDAMLYGLGNWYLYHGDTSKAIKVMSPMSSPLTLKASPSFGYMAYVSDWSFLQDFRKK